MLFGNDDNQSAFGLPSIEQMMKQRPGYVAQQGLDPAQASAASDQMGSATAVNPYASPFKQQKGLFGPLSNLPSLK